MATGKLDPKDWTGFRADAHKMLDAALDKLEKAEEGRVWTPLPDAKKAELNIKVPEIGKSPSEVRDALEGMLPYGVGNTHPRFWGWVHGTGTASGLMSDIATSVINANLGGRDHGGIHVEKSVLRWCKEMMGFPASAGGLLTSGTSMATVIAVKCARETALGFDIRKKGLSELDLVGYCSEQTHSCVARAFDLLGLGSDRLRQIPCNDAFQMDLGALEAAMTKDRAAGLRPFFVTGTAGAVNVGAIDDLEALADLCQAQGLWYHVDGALGAAARLSPALAPLLKGMERADSLAFDFHKWMHVTYDAGCILIRDASVQLRAFSERPAYLAPATRGLAAGDFWPVDYGPELSRGYRALKVWAHLQEHGTKALGEAVAENCRQARLLADLVDATSELHRVNPVTLGIVCFKYLPRRRVDSDAINSELVIRLQESGLAVVSTTILNQELAIRVNITNHRTRDADLTHLIKGVLATGAEIDAEAA